MNIDRVAALALAACLLADLPARAQDHRAGVATIGNDSTPSPRGGARMPDLNGCAQGCLRQVKACSLAGSGTRDVSGVANRCAQQAQQCITACSGSGGSGAAGAPDVSAILASLTGDSGQSSGAESDSGNDGAANLEGGNAAQLEADWQRGQQARTALLTQQAQDLLGLVRRILCQQAGGSGGNCSVAQPGRSLPPGGAPTADRRASDRFHTPKPSPGEAPKSAVPAPRSKPPGGCYVRKHYVVNGNWADKLFIETPLQAWFRDSSGRDSPTGDVLHVENNGEKEVWIGRPTPINDRIPPHGSVDYPASTYRSRDDDRVSHADIDVKVWTDSADECKTGATDPGFTTPAEWGPSSPGPTGKGGATGGSKDPREQSIQ